MLDVCFVHRRPTRVLKSKQLQRQFKIKITKSPNPEENPNEKSQTKRQNQKIKHIKRMDNNRHTPDLEHAFSHVENGGLNLVL